MFGSNASATAFILQPTGRLVAAGTSYGPSTASGNLPFPLSKSSRTPHDHRYTNGRARRWLGRALAQHVMVMVRMIIIHQRRG
jgi:hypothetical protein